MHCALAASLFSVWLAAPPGDSGHWGDALFTELSHDFGVVAGGSNTSHRFVLRNTLDRPVRIAAFTASCGCTEIAAAGRVVRPSTPGETISLSAADRIVVNPGDKIDIEIVLDTRKFVGQTKSSTVTVVFDQPARADVRLTISAYIRQDVVLNPGNAQFGSMARGTGGERTIEIEYAGASNLQIQGIEWQSQAITASLVEMYRRAGGVGYRVEIKLKSDAPAGAVRDTIRLKTSDARTPEIPIAVEGFIQPDIIMTPSNLFLGELRPGQSESRKVLLRAARPFQITGVEGGDDSLIAEFSNKTERIHTVTIRYKAGSQPGVFDRALKLKTNLDSEPAVELKTRAQVAL
jgi:hypothetical protein